MIWSTEVVASLTSDTEPTIMVTFDDSKYLFNTSENTMRSFLQSNRIWRRTKCLFFTQARIEKISGLPGLIMTFADATIDKLKLVGPIGLTHLLASMRSYTYRDSILMQTHEVPWITQSTSNPTPCFSDDNIDVYSIPVIPSSSPKLSLPPPLLETTSELMEENTNVTSGKRKRDLSADTPRKRLNTLDETSKELDQMDTYQSTTNDGSDEDLDAYRQRMIQSMFPATNIPSPQEVERCAREVRAGIDVPPTFSNGDLEERRKRSPPLQGFYSQLPKFTNPLPPHKAPATVCYLVVGPKYRGKFDVAKATELQVPKGRIRGQLTKGETVTFEVIVNGEKVERTVSPDDVVGKSDPRAATLILDIPTPDHIPGLISSFEKSNFYRNFWTEDPSSVTAVEDPAYILRTIYQTCGQGVLEDERYKAFLRGFGPETHHVIASREHCADPITFTSVTQNQLRLSHLDDKLFPVPKYSLAPKKDLSTIPGLPANVQPMTSSLRNTMRPWSAPSSDESVITLDRFHPFVNGSQPLKFSPQLQRYIKKAQDSVSTVLASGELKPVEGADIGIITLGTGGSLPSKYRNVLSTLVKIPNWGNILLDAGEGTWGQLARTFGLQDGPDNVWQTLRDIKCIFISHIHADHHAGLSHILAKRRRLDPPPNEPLYIVSVRATHLYLRELQDIQDIGVDDPSGNGIIPVLSEALHFSERGSYATHGMWQIGGNEPWVDYNTSVENGRKMCEALGLESFKTADVEHRCRAFGASFRHKDGWSITFSGDTAPSASLRKIGMDSTVLIHEATMCDDELDLARRKAHSTIGQAIDQGDAMNAKNVILTHFSARYAKVPPNIVRTITPRRVTSDSYSQERLVIPAFDYLNLTISDLWKIQFYLPAIILAIHDGGDNAAYEDWGSRSPSRSLSRSPSPPQKMRAAMHG